MTDFDRSQRALEGDTRTKERAALDVAMRALTIIARPIGGESELEQAMRLAAEVAIERIRSLVPEAGAPREGK
jgi:hypothetical protein